MIRRDRYQLQRGNGNPALATPGRHRNRDSGSEDGVRPRGHGRKPQPRSLVPGEAHPGRIGNDHRADRAGGGMQPPSGPRVDARSRDRRTESGKSSGALRTCRGLNGVGQATPIQPFLDRNASRGIRDGRIGNRGRRHRLVRLPLRAGRAGTQALTPPHGSRTRSSPRLQATRPPRGRSSPGRQPPFAETGCPPRPVDSKSRTHGGRAPSCLPEGTSTGGTLEPWTSRLPTTRHARSTWSA